MQTFSEQLTAARKAKGMTQEALANAAAVTRQTISSWERGRTIPDIDTIRRLSDILGADLLQSAEAENAVPVIEAAEEVGTRSAPDSLNADYAQRVQRRAKTPWIIAGAAALACVVLLFALLLPREPVSTGERDVFNAEVFRQKAANEAGKAYITFENRTWEEKGENDIYQRYDFTMVEHNGVGFSIARLKLQCEGKSGTILSKNIGVNDFRAIGQGTEIPPYGSLVIDGGFPKGEFSRVGITVYGNDANGAPLTFYNLIEL